ncbi:MAG TPA: ribosome maturation factor RimP, partial [Nitrospirae bacterium]|nr:ribosome maturation factor RimP [Nitrospirota bacterium]
MSTVIDRIYKIASTIADENGFEVVKVELLGKGKRTILRVFIDRVGGVTI